MKHREPVKLTENQRFARDLFCTCICAACGVLTLWAGMWFIYALTQGVFSAMHFVLFIIGLFFAVVFGDIAGVTKGEGEE